MAQFEYIREKLKLQITTNLAGSTSPSFTLSGGLDLSKFVIVMKAHNSREQKLLGEVFGQNDMRKSTKENRWVTSFDLEDSIFSMLLILGVVYVSMSKGQSR